MGLFGLPKKKRAIKVQVSSNCIANLGEVIFGPPDAIPQANWEAYSTCRGHKTRAELERIFDVIADTSGTYSRDQREDAINDGLWDWLCHQYTLYSVTPLVLNYVINRFTPDELKAHGLDQFVDVCRRSGTASIMLTDEEIAKNQNGELPMFRIEDALLGYQKP